NTSPPRLVVSDGIRRSFINEIRDIKETIDEATRRNPDACLHVENPGRPGLGFGQDLEAHIC
ncbi:hypothetical protein, partial [Gluconobacter sp. P1D12_c]|uniref:hypothetical protein n=1 Tax=Gluconobacter sp. P1D12_c TaxID=2762614 RepID=UPI001C0466AC